MSISFNIRTSLSVGANLNTPVSCTLRVSDIDCQPFFRWILRKPGAVQRTSRAAVSLICVVVVEMQVISEIHVIVIAFQLQTSVGPVPYARNLRSFLAIPATL